MPFQKSDQVHLKAYAKINLSLKVSGKRSDGFHDIDSLMQSISLHDELYVRRISHGIKVKCSSSKITDNIAEKAAELILKEAKIDSGVEIDIKKNIPIAAGLAGGSADAAATLIGIDKLYGLNFHKAKLIELGAKIGSDVPFCLIGGTCRCTGRGEKVEHDNTITGNAYILAFPKIEVSTKLVYEQFDKVGSNSDNDLEKAAIGLFPEIGKIKAQLNAIEGGGWRMSGSGPTLFIELGDLSEVDRYNKHLIALGINFQIALRADHGVEIV